MALRARESTSISESDERLRQQVACLQKLYRANLELGAGLDITCLLETILSQAMGFVNGNCAELYLYSEQNGLERYEVSGETVQRIQQGEEAAQKVWAAGQPLVVNEYEHGQGELRIATAGVPICRRAASAPQGCAGVLLVQAGRAFTQGEVELLEMFARQAALAIKNARVHAVALSYADRMVSLQQFAQALTASLDFDSVAGTALTHLQQLFAATRVSLLQIAAESGQLCYTRTLLGTQAIDTPVRLQLGSGVAGWALERAAPLVIEDAQEDARFVSSLDECLGCTTRALMAIPLLTRESVIGVLEVANSRPGLYTRSDLNDMQAIAPILIVALDNARLYAELQAERVLLAQRVAERTAELSVVNAELIKAARLKDEFLANVSHELRTPLNAILGMAQILCEQAFGPLNERQLKSLNTIYESGQRLLRIINHILDLSKLEAGKVKLYLNPVMVESICQASLESVRQKASEKYLTVSLAVDSTATELQADERHLRQILLNLLDNAVKFTPEGGTIGLKVRGDEERQLMHFVVWDTGIGIAAQDKDKLFQPFVQLDGSLSRQYDGAGLGLSLVQRLAQLHGGSVTIESEPGQGSTFTVSLPWQK